MKNLAPAVYKYTCPDGRVYVGGCPDWRTRDRYGLKRSNSRMKEAFKKHPPETWTFEILEKLKPGCWTKTLRRAEQRHIVRLRSWDPKYGFNIFAAARARPAPVIGPIKPGQLLLRKEHVLELVFLRSYNALRQWMKSEGFPHPIELGPSDIAWIAAEVYAWISSRPQRKIGGFKEIRAAQEHNQPCR